MDARSIVSYLTFALLRGGGGYHPPYSFSQFFFRWVQIKLLASGYLLAALIAQISFTVKKLQTFTRRYPGGVDTTPAPKFSIFIIFFSAQNTPIQYCNLL